MPTYSTSAAGTVGAGSDKIFEFDTVTIASGEQFKRCKIEIQGSYSSNARLRGNAQSVLGQSGWNTWTTDRTAISWPNNGKKPKVTVHNNGTTGYSWRVIVTIESEPKPEHTITCTSGTGGTLTANKSKAVKNETVTLTPVPAAGYQLSSITTNVSGVTVSNNKFTMPDQNITVTATWTKINYAITKAVSPSGAGTVSGSSSAQMGASVTLTQIPNSGYFFDHWSISSGTISSGGTFTMPAGNVTVTAHYVQRSTATLNKSTLKGGETAVLTIVPASSIFSHKYQLSFGTGMETDLTAVPAGTTSLTLNIPASWAGEIPNAATKTGGTLKVETYNGTTKIGEYTISSLTYQVPDDAVPSISDIVTSIARTIGGTTYANIGDYYVQSKCGVEIEAEAAGAYSATIAGMAVSVSGYSGSGYAGTVADDEIDFTTGLLTIAGSTIITVTATDSRGRTATKTATITVMPYTAPAGTLAVERADVNGDPDDVGEYGIFELTKQYTQIGSNTLTATLTSQSVSVTVTAEDGDLLPGTGNRQTFQRQYEYTVTLTLTDAFETVTMTAKLRSAKFVLHVDSGGDRIAFFEAVSKSIPAGKTSLMQISGDTQIYLGNDKLEDYFNNLLTVVQENLVDNKSLTAGQSYAESYAITPPTGYTPVGIVGFVVANATVDGFGCTWVSYNYSRLIYENNTWTVSVQYRNHHTAAVTIRLYAMILYRKNL